ncbi:MAG: hypothetical protein IKG01_07895 [Lachnospiraceae bacterium]|nr:hypothetical protein [Lachnospiraceae bacterium]
MGIDWEDILGAEGEDLERAYNDAIPDPQPYMYDDDYEDWSEYDGSGEEDVPEEGETDPEVLRSTPLRELSDAEKKAAFNANNDGTPYLLAVLKGEKNNWKGNDTTLTGMDDREYPARDRLFHANSVKTAVSFIRNKGLFSRAYGEARGLQTAQDSDQADKLLGIYNDIFFDNVDIPHISGTNRSAYGPVMFVLRPDVLSGHKVRILKSNPWIREDRDTLTYNDLFFSGIEEIKTIMTDGGHIDINRVAFLGDFDHHTTVFDTALLPFDGNLEAIYVEQCPDGSGKENELKSILENELRISSLNVPVIIRKDPPDASFTGLAASEDDLWFIDPDDISPDMGD